MTGRRSGQQWLSNASLALLMPAFALLGNMATNTVKISWQWWPLTVWTAVLVLVVATTRIEVRRHTEQASNQTNTQDEASQVQLPTRSEENFASTAGLRRGNPDLESEHVDRQPLIITKEVLHVDYFRDTQSNSSPLIPASGHTLRLFVETQSRERIILRSLQPEILHRDPAKGRLLPHAGLIETRAFRLDLSNDVPHLKAVNRKEDFPMWVSRGEPEVIDISVVNNRGIVSWRLFLNWSASGRTGSVTIDFDGEPFVTSQRPS
jgi:hypothetical protein